MLAPWVTAWELSVVKPAVLLVPTKVATPQTMKAVPPTIVNCPMEPTKLPEAGQFATPGGRATAIGEAVKVASDPVAVMTQVVGGDNELQLAPPSSQ